MNGVFLGGKLQEISSVDTNFIKQEVNSLTSQETEIQNRIERTYWGVLGCIRRKYMGVSSVAIKGAKTVGKYSLKGFEKVENL